MLLLILLLGFEYSPADSSWDLVTLADIPERAILFAELAAREGGRAAVDLGCMLELSGSFEEASDIFEIAGNSADDSLMTGWLRARVLGTKALDTLIVLSIAVENTSDVTARDVALEVPMPESHPPYQSVRIVGSAFRMDGDILRTLVESIPASSTVRLPLVISVSQDPYTYRPLPDSYSCAGRDVALEIIARTVRSIDVPVDSEGPGPCLEVACALRDSAEAIGMEFDVVGGLLRTDDGDLLFHAWNSIRCNGLPVDVSLFHADSLRGIGHCPTDIIPLWDLGRVDGHEVSAYYSQQEVDLAVSMKASFADPALVNDLLDIFPICFLKKR